jgi:uncharacterized protein (TIGR03663 family)
MATLVQPRPIAELRRQVAPTAPAPTVPRFNLELGIYLALALLALVMRLALLGDKPLHHDESLHATYTWYLFTGKGYHYDPMMHGPLQFLVTTAIFALVGVSDFTVRLLPALCGTAIVVWPYFLRRELGRLGAIFAAAVLMVSPSFLYFSRFYRNDIYVAFFTLGMVVCYWRFLRDHRRRWVIGALALLALSLTAKEVTYITMFIFGLWVLGTLAWERLGHRQMLMAACRAAGSNAFLAGLAVFAAIFIFFFTTAFSWWPGLHDGIVKGVQYWLSQQPVARGSEPWWYYASLLGPYEPLEVALAVAGAVIAVRRRTGFLLFLSWWALGSLIIYSWAGEKMPWLILHPLLPLVMLAAVAFQALCRTHRHVLTGLAWCGVALGGIYMVHSAIPLAYYHPADPAEMLVYTQTSTDVLDAMRQIDAVALRSGDSRQMRVLVDPEDWWPFVWYLRDYPNAVPGAPTSSGGNPPVVIAADSDNAAAEALLAGGYREEHLKLREWWLPDWHAQSVQNWWNWLIYRQIWNPRGSTDFYLFIRNDLSVGL